MVLPVAALALVYLAMAGSWTPWDLAVGVGAGFLLVWGLPRDGLPHGRVMPVLRLLGSIGVEFWKGTVRVLRELPSGAARAGFVEVPFGERSEEAIALSGVLATMAPDEFLVHVDWPRRVMVYHVIDASDPDTVRRRHDHLYRTYVQPIEP